MIFRISWLSYNARYIAAISFCSCLFLILKRGATSCISSAMARSLTGMLLGRVLVGIGLGVGPPVASLYVTEVDILCSAFSFL